MRNCEAHIFPAGNSKIEIWLYSLIYKLHSHVTTVTIYVLLNSVWVFYLLGIFRVGIGTHHSHIIRRPWMNMFSRITIKNGENRIVINVESIIYNELNIRKGLW